MFLLRKKVIRVTDTAVPTNDNTVMDPTFMSTSSSLPVTLVPKNHYEIINTNFIRASYIFKPLYHPNYCQIWIWKEVLSANIIFTEYTINTTDTKLLPEWAYSKWQADWFKRAHDNGGKEVAKTQPPRLMLHILVTFHCFSNWSVLHSTHGVHMYTPHANVNALVQ